MKLLICIYARVCKILAPNAFIFYLSQRAAKLVIIFIILIVSLQAAAGSFLEQSALRA